MSQFMQKLRMAGQAYGRGDYTHAVRLCDQLETQHGAHEDQLNIKAISLLALGQIEAAETTIRQALKLNPRLARIHLNAALSYKSLSLSKQIKCQFPCSCLW